MKVRRLSRWRVTVGGLCWLLGIVCPVTVFLVAKFVVAESTAGAFGYAIIPGLVFFVLAEAFSPS